MMYYRPDIDRYEEQEGGEGAAFVSVKSGGAAQVLGAATGGSSTTIIDTSKNWPVNFFAGMQVKLTSTAGIEYLRTVISNTANTLTVAELCAAVNGTAVLFPGYSYEVTATGAAAAAAAAGNAYNFVVVAGEGNDVALSAVLAETTVTVTLGTGAEGALDDAKNTATLIAAAIDALDDFVGTVTGATASDPATTFCTISVSGGADAYGGVSGNLYEILGETVKLSGSKTGNCVSASVTRLDNTTAYAAGDVVGNTTYLEFANVGVAGQEICIYDITLMVKKADTALAGTAGAASYKVYLYTDAPTAIADNAAWTLGIADADKYARIVAQTGAVSDRGDVLVAAAEAINRFVKLTGTGLYAYLVTDSVYTPVALTVQDLELHYSAI